MTPYRVTLLCAYAAFRDKPSTIAFVGPESAIVTTGDGALFLLDTREASSGLQKLGSHRSYVNRVLVTGDGRAVTSSYDRTIIVWDLIGRQSLAVLDAHPGHIEQLSTSGQRVLLHTFDGVLKIMSLDDGALVCAFQGDKQITVCAADAELKWVVALDQAGQMHFLCLEESA